MANVDSASVMTEARLPLNECEFRAAMRALHRIMIYARQSAYLAEDHQKIADILDSAELMPLLLVEPTAGLSFADMLQDLGERILPLRGVWLEYQAAIEAIKGQSR